MLRCKNIILPPNVPVQKFTSYIVLHWRNYIENLTLILPGMLPLLSYSQYHLVIYLQLIQTRYMLPML